MMREEQAKVSAFIQAYGLGQNPQVRMLDLISEVGELSKELLKASGYGELPVELTASIKEELGIPVKYIGVGEGIDDLRPFNPEEFAKIMFDK